MYKACTGHAMLMAEEGHTGYKKEAFHIHCSPIIGKTFGSMHGTKGLLGIQGQTHKKELILICFFIT